MRRLNSAFALLLTLPLSVLSTISCMAADIYVPDQYATIQAAIDAASDAGTVIIRNGAYKGVGNVNIDFKGKAVTLKSENGPELCTLDCEGITGNRGFYFHSGETSESLVQGFTIKNGKVLGEHGGGILIDSSSPRIDNCRIIQNEAIMQFQDEDGKIVAHGGSGGGIFFYKSSATISNCFISENQNSGGGSSSSGSGGGIYMYGSSVSISKCAIENNTSSYGSGGGISCYWFNGDYSPTITGCRIAGNSPSGISIMYSSVLIAGCIVSGNNGIGISFSDNTSSHSSPRLINSILYDNSTGVNISYCPVFIGNSTMTANGTGVRYDFGYQPPGTPLLANAIANSIVWGNAEYGIKYESYPYGSSHSITFSDIQTGHPGEGNIDLPPYFVDPANCNYRLTAGSSCINTGSNDAYSLSPTDLDGRPRILAGRVDMGAYEFGTVSMPGLPLLLGD